MIVAKASYEVSEPTVDSQMLQLKSSGADVFFNIRRRSSRRRAIRAAYDTGWKPTHYLNTSPTRWARSSSRQAGKGRGHSSPAPTSRTRLTSAGRTTRRLKTWREFMAKYNPDGDLERSVQRLRLLGRHDARAGAEAVRRHTDARERDEAAEPEAFPHRDAAARHRHQPPPAGRLCADRSDGSSSGFNGHEFELFGEVISNEAVN